MEGPHLSITPGRSVCNFCEHCSKSEVRSMSSVTIIAARCSHPSIKDVLSFDSELTFSHDQVFTPLWCPVVKERRTRNERHL